MKYLLTLCCVCCLWVGAPLHVRADSLSAYGEQGAGSAQARKTEREHARYLHKANQYSLNYLREARNFRVRGRYELARQRYLQALSICGDQQTLGVIQRELDGVEMLLRSMR